VILGLCGVVEAAAEFGDRFDPIENPNLDLKAVR